MAQNVTAADFEAEVLKAQGVVLVDFWAPWCGPCQMLTPVLEELGADLADDEKVVKVNVDDCGDLAAQYGVMSIPALKVFKDGEIVEEAVGMQSKDALKELLERNK